MQYMFESCRSLEGTLDLSDWNVSQVTTVAYMFRACTKLQSIILDNWSLSALTANNYWFADCNSLKTLSYTSGTIKSSTTNTNVFTNLYSLQNYTGIPFANSITYTGLYSISYSSMIAMLTVLPSVSSKTIKVSTTALNRISATDKAIATAKGWSIAA